MSHAPVQTARKPAVPDPPDVKPIPLHLAVVPTTRRAGIVDPLTGRAAAGHEDGRHFCAHHRNQMVQAGPSADDKLADGEIDGLLAAPPAIEGVDIGELSWEPAAPDRPTLLLVAAVAPEPATPDAADNG